MARLILTGVVEAASKYVVRARQQLAHLKQRMAIYGDTSSSLPPLLFPDAVIKVRSHFGEDLIDIQGLGGGEFIVCFVGDTTGDFSSKRFYTLAGKEMGRDEEDHPYHPPGWKLADDGLYGLIPGALDPVNPWNNSYGYDPGGLGIPSCASGISAKKQSGMTARYILNSAIEDETFQSMSRFLDYTGTINDYTYYFLRQVDSLTDAPYSIYGPRPYFTKYIGDKVIAMIVPWAGEESTFTWDAYLSDNFRDVIPKVKKIWQVDADGARTGTDIVDYGESNDAVIGAAAFKDGDDLKVNVVRAKTNTWYGSLMSEPIRNEVYNITGATMTTGTVIHRGDDPDDENCYFWDGETDSSTYPYYATAIADDVNLVHSIDDKGRQTYVRVRKTGNFDSVNTGLYCFGDLIEESGWEDVTKPHEATDYAPVLIRGTRYRIIHAYSEGGFKVVLYSKTVHSSHSDELLPYKKYLSPVGDYCQLRKTMIRSYTTYHISVNGVITSLDYSNYRREYKVTILNTAYSGPSIPTVTVVANIPWVDAGYDADGNPLEEDNKCVMRCDTSSSKGRLIVGFDVFPVDYRHDFVHDSHGNLTLVFDEGVTTFPPVSDATYPDVSDRKWLLFGTDGAKIKEITPPQKEGGGHVPRINGLAFIGV